MHGFKSTRKKNKTSVATAGTNIYFHRSQPYSINAPTDSTAQILERYSYSAYGTPTITSSTGTLRDTSQYSNRYTYTGREWDEDLGIYQYRARMYNARLGRFCLRDPGGYVDGRKLYRSFFEPTDLDPTGRSLWDCRPGIREKDGKLCGYSTWLLTRS